MPPVHRLLHITLDTTRWFSPERHVQARWAREYYGAGASEEEKKKEVEA